MATLEPKSDVLRLLERQQTDGTGPGYISALDVQTACGNLYDQISVVNAELALVPTSDQVQAQLAYINQLERARLQLLKALVGPTYTLVPLTLNALQAELVNYLSMPGEIVAAPGSTIVGTGITGAFVMSDSYTSDIPVSWGNEVVTYKEGTTTVGLYWWNGRNFELVGAVPTTKPNRAAVKPNDVFTTADLTNYRVTNPSELLVYLTGDTATWTAAGAGAKFTINSVSGSGTPLLYNWVPTVGQVPGHFVTGVK